MEYTVLSYSTKSRLHTNNEDAHFICDNYVIIADGMGGESDGDIASRIAVETIVDALSHNLLDVSTDFEIKALSAKAICESDAKISEYVDKHPDSFGMGTTVLLAVVKEDKLHISWCGDSHGYVYRGGVVRSLTKDHSYIQELIDSGKISVEESFSHPDNNLITRYVGGGVETCSPDFCIHTISDSEIIVFCSDGLSGYCKHNDIAQEINQAESLDELPRNLSDLAVRYGSEDDITVIILIPTAYTSSQSIKSKFGWLKRLFHLQ